MTPAETSPRFPSPLCWLLEKGQSTVTGSLGPGAGLPEFRLPRGRGERGGLGRGTASTRLAFLPRCVLSPERLAGAFEMTDVASAVESGQGTGAGSLAAGVRGEKS